MSYLPQTRRRSQALVWLRNCPDNIILDALFSQGPAERLLCQQHSMLSLNWCHALTSGACLGCKHDLRQLVSRNWRSRQRGTGSNPRFRSS